MILLKKKQRVLAIFIALAFASLSGCMNNSIATELPVAAIPVSTEIETANINKQADPNSDRKSLVISGTNQSLSTQSSMQGNTLSFGNIEVKHWPLIKAPCVRCEVILDRRFHSDGPTAWLVIKDEDKTTWIASSFQKQFNTEQWQFKHHEDQVTITDASNRNLSKKQTVITANIQSAIPLKSDKNCSVLWANKEFLQQPGKHISADVAQFNSQFIIQCKAPKK